MKDEADVRNHAQKILLVSVVQGNGILVVRCHENLRAGALSENLLLFIQGVAYGIYVLLEDKLVQKWQICGIVPHRILYEKNALDTASEDIGRGVRAVFQKFDDGKDEVCGAVPAEGVVYRGTVHVLHAAVYLLGVCGKENYRHVILVLFHAGGEGKDVVSNVVHGYYKVELLPCRSLFKRLPG